MAIVNLSLTVINFKDANKPTYCCLQLDNKYFDTLTEDQAQAVITAFSLAIDPKLTEKDNSKTSYIYT